MSLPLGGRIKMQVPSSALENPSAIHAAAQGKDNYGGAVAFAYFNNHLHVHAKIEGGGEQTWTDLQVAPLEGETAYRLVVTWDATCARLTVNDHEQDVRFLPSQTAPVP